jgi:hypothetical protein
MVPALCLHAGRLGEKEKGLAMRMLAGTTRRQDLIFVLSLSRPTAAHTISPTLSLCTALVAWCVSPDPPFLFHSSLFGSSFIIYNHS